MNVCDLEEEKRERSLDNNSYVSDQDMCFRKKGRREKTRSDRIFGKRKSDFEMGGPVFIGDKKVAVAGGGSSGRPLVFGLKMFKKYDEESLKAQESLLEKLSGQSDSGHDHLVLYHGVWRLWQFCDLILEIAFEKDSCLVRDMQWRFK
ncbi:hypothetical protein Tco_0810171 [Tanacetum coccineum]